VAPLARAVLFKPPPITLAKAPASPSRLALAI
jgi:hypothetical protein